MKILKIALLSYLGHLAAASNAATARYGPRDEDSGRILQDFSMSAAEARFDGGLGWGHGPGSEASSGGTGKSSKSSKSSKGYKSSKGSKSKKDHGGAPFGTVPPGLNPDGSDSQPAWEAFVESVFPTWCIDGEENRIHGVETCADGTANGRYDPLYLTKWRSGEDPALGGYPTDVDTRYPFYYAAPFFGQACAGGNSHCSRDFDGNGNNCAKCGKIATDSDDGPNGPGHVPPHIGLAALTRAYHDGGFGKVGDWFDYAQNGCRVLPTVLLPMIRKYFPRDAADGNKAKYPPPFTMEGGPGSMDGTSYPYPLEYVNLVGSTCEAEKAKFPSAECFEQHSGGDASDYPDYLEPGHGSPHYCTVEGMAADVNKDHCPYIFFGPNRGGYRHPHIAYAAVETWLANKAMPGKCGPTWDDNDGADYPFTPDHSVAFPKMSSVAGHAADPKQPTIAGGKFIWPGDEGTKEKKVPGLFVVEKW